VESNTWFQDGDDDYVSAKGADTNAVNNCIDSFVSAWNLLEHRSFQKAGHFLVKGSAFIRDVLLEEHPRLLSRLFRIVFLLREGGWIDCSNIILNQFSEMAATVLIEMHPLRTIFTSLISFDPNLVEDVFISSWESFTDVSEQTLGSSSLGSIQTRADYIYGIERGRDPNIAEAQLCSMVEKYKEAYGTLDLRYVQALLCLTDFFCAQGRIRDAAAAAEEAVYFSSKCESQHATGLWCNGMGLLADCQNLIYDGKLAESTLRQAIDVSRTTWGWQDSYVLKLLTKLEAWLTEFGKHDEVAEVSEQIAEILRQSNDFL
jgi:hypothetical protein